MNYENLKDAIIAVIKQNGNEEITGNILQQVLVAMVNSLGSGYQFRGIATPGTNPGTPDQRVFYLASTPGTYSDFGFIVSDEICVLVYDTAWHKQTIIALDQEPTEDSGNLISSGAIYTALQNLADVYMQLVEDADEDHIATFGENGQVKDSGLSLDDVAKAKGSFPELFAGFAGNLVDTRSAGTRQGPFAFRQSGGDGVNYMRKILGRTEAWNQLLKNGNMQSLANWSGPMGKSVSNNELTAVSVSGSENATMNSSIPIVSLGHKYYAAFSYISNQILYIQYPGAVQQNVPIATLWTRVSKVYTPVSNVNALYFFNFSELAAGDWTLKLRDVVIIDLTLMFGAGNEPATPEAFEALHPLPYYAYNAGVLKNNAATGLETTGFNQWDEEWEPGAFNTSTGAEIAGVNQIRAKNYIPVIEGAQYNLYSGGAGYVSQVLWFDAQKAFISTNTPPTGNNFIVTVPTGARYMRFQTQQSYGSVYGNNICINRSDASRNGTYEPYWKREIVLGLDSLACHDENNNAVVVNGLDGVGTSQDELIVENGWGTKINKRRARVDLGGLSWQLQSGYTDSFYALIPGGVGSNDGICPKYVLKVGGGYLSDKEFALINNNIYIKDAAYSDSATFKAAMAGVYLDYPLTTPKVLTVDNPFPAFVEVDNLGTEKRLPEDTADNPQGPFECDSNYSISTANLVRKLSEL